jgi:hypothetical protein
MSAIIHIDAPVAVSLPDSITSKVHGHGIGILLSVIIGSVD